MSAVGIVRNVSAVIMCGQSVRADPKWTTNHKYGALFFNVNGVHVQLFCELRLFQHRNTSIPTKCCDGGIFFLLDSKRTISKIEIISEGGTFPHSKGMLLLLIY